MKPILIESAAELDKHFDTLRSEKLLAVDTEFFRETTYFPQLGLIQLANSKIVACIDPLAFDAQEQVATILLDREITKVFHSCSQDMEVLQLYLGALPCPVLDTQIANSLLCEADQIGYAKLVESEFDVSLDKSQTRTNWLKRPLSAKQLDYAGDDVFYLHQLIAKLMNQLTALDRQNWLLEDCAALCESPEKYQPNTRNCGSRVKGTHKLGAYELAIINAVANWRERLAIDKDKTRRRILPDDEVVNLALNKPKAIDQLRDCGQLRRHLNGSELQSLDEVLQQAYQIPQQDWPDPRNRKPEPKEKETLRSLQKLVNDKAESLGISASVLCSRKEMLRLIDGKQDIKALGGWRSEQIGRQLLDELKRLA